MRRHLSLWFRALLQRRRVDHDLDDELAFHLARETAELVSTGVDPQAARKQATVKFGPVASVTDECRDTRRVRLADALTRDTVADVRSAGRQFARHPLVAMTMVVVLALGIGFSAAVFVFVSSLVSGVPAGVPRDPSVVRVRGIDRSGEAGRTIGREFSYQEYQVYAQQADTFANVAAWTSVDVVLGGGGGAPSLQSGAASFVTADYFAVLGVHPVVGAGLPAASDDGEPVLAGVISHIAWDRLFDRASDIVGRRLDVNGTAISIVGVAPPAFAGARTGGSAMRVWLPLNARPVIQPSAGSNDDAVFGIVARLQSGVGLEQATSAVETLDARFQPAGAIEGRPGRSADVVALLAGNYFPPSGEAPGIAGRIVTVSIPVLVLLITCTNVGTLLTGLSIGRRREIAVRLSLGARRRRVVRQLLTETALVAILGGALGLLVVWIVLSIVDASVVMAIPIVPDWRAAVFTLAVAIGVAVVFGLSPSLNATRVPLSSVMRESDVTVTRSRLQVGLVIAQIALTQPVLISMASALLHLRGDLQEQTSLVAADRILEVHFNTNPRYGALDERREESLQRVGVRLMSLPGVEAVVPQEAGYGWLEFSVHQSDRAADAEGHDEAGPSANVAAAPPGHFALMGTPVSRGRDFVDNDVVSPGAIIVTAPLAHRLWGTADPVGRRLVAGRSSLRGWPGVLTVVGVVGDGGRADVGDERVFIPHVGTTGHFLLRTAEPAERMVPTIRATALAEAPEAPIVSVRTLAAVEAAALASTTRGIMAAGGIGLLGLLLAAIGLYATVALAVRQRVREIGIRAALGASRTRIVWGFVMRGLRASVIGLTIGLVLSIVAVRVVASIDGEPPPSGLLGLSALVALFVVSVAVLAAWLPARRAAHLDPLDALRLD